MRITSRSSQYDSAWRPLAATSDGTHWIGHWDTWSLKPARDYSIAVRVQDATGVEATEVGPTLPIVTLPILSGVSSETVDARATGRVLSAEFVRSHNLYRADTDGPLGYGWTHSYALSLHDYEDGTVEIREAGGGASWYSRGQNELYSGRPNDAAFVRRRADGLFERVQKDGIVQVFASNGRLASIREPNENSLTLDYDSGLRLIGVETSTGARLVLRYDDRGHLISVSGSAGRETKYAYDAEGNLVTASSPGASDTRYEYDTYHRLTLITLPNGRVIRNEYGLDGRLMLRRDTGGSSSGYEYDDVRQEVTITDASGSHTKVAFDSFNNVAAVTDALGNRTAFTLDPRHAVTAITDPAGHRQTLRYDAQGNLAARADPTGAETAVVYEQARARPIAITDPLRRVTTLAYDDRGNPTTTRYPDGSTEQYIWNADGTVRTQTDRAGRTTTFGYDARGRLSLARYGDGTSVAYSYDDADNLTAAMEGGQETRYEYDTAGHLTAVLYPNGQTLRYVYDAAGQRIRRSGPGSISLQYSYTAGRLTTIRDGSDRVFAEYAYDAAGRLDSARLGNGVRTTYRYDQTGRLVEVRSVTSSGAVVAFSEYTYDNLGNRTVVRNADGPSSFGYDANSALTAATYADGRQERFDYDATGARTSVSKGDTRVGYALNSVNQIASVGSTAYEYDRNGNRTFDGRGRYEWDARNRLTRATVGNTDVRYEYDFLGRRVAKVTGTQRIGLLWDGLKLAADLADDGTIQASYVHGNGLDELVAVQRNGATLYYVQDGLGSVVALTDETGRVVERRTYDAFGATSTRGDTGNRFGFTGRELDSETGLYYYRARYYDPITGSFLSVDPAERASSADTYNYAANNPVIASDPLGLFFVIVPAPEDRICPGHGPALGCTYRRPGPLPSATIWVDWDALTPYGRLITWTHEWLHYRYPVMSETNVQVLAEISTYAQSRALADLRRRYPDLYSLYFGDPTFVQLPRSSVRPPLIRSRRSHEDLVARIDVPAPGSLVRANVPVFGVASGQGFKQFRLEYGKGENPSSWIAISASTAPEDRSDLSRIDLSGDLTINGNLGTWDTGLQGYVYLPSHPSDHPVDLRGVYTIRLVVTGSDGAVAEDRTTVEVGEAVPNAWGATVRSDDDKVALTIPEQSLTDAFRVIAIRRLEHPPAAISEPVDLSGQIYQVREAGERFLKPVSLAIRYENPSKNANLTIVAWDSGGRRWIPVPSQADTAAGTIRTQVRQLSPYYAVAAGVTEIGTIAGQQPAASTLLPALSANGSSYLVRNTFEEGLAQWSNRDGEFGGDVALDNSGTDDGTTALRVSRRSARGNFAVNVFRGPFDAKEYPIVQFDYRIRPDVRTDFFARVSGRWYLVRFTGGQKDWQYRRVNIAELGVVEGVRADDRWHTARFNLLDLLLTRTGTTIVDELVMADWDLGGFMRLQLSSAEQGTAYFIDNFQIRREPLAGLQIAGDGILIDDFNNGKDSNALGGSWSTYQDGSGSAIQLALLDAGCEEAVGCLGLSYDLSTPGSFAGAVTSLEGLDLRGYHSLRFKVRADSEGQDLVIGLKDRTGSETKLLASRFMGRTLPLGWATLEIPLVAFTNLTTWSALENLSLSMEKRHNSQARIFVDDIEVRRSLSRIDVEDFQAEADTNHLQKENHAIVKGDVAINGVYSTAGQNRFYRLSYGGNIGAINSLAKDPFSYGGWATGLGGINCSQCGVVALRIRGADGGETPRIYLDDGNFRWGVEIGKYATVKTSWTDVLIPLEDFARYGVDLTHLAELQVIFEWEKMSGTVFLDDIRFGPPSFPPTATGRSIQPPLPH